MIIHDLSSARAITIYNLKNINICDSDLTDSRSPKHGEGIRLEKACYVRMLKSKCDRSLKSEVKLKVGSYGNNESILSLGQVWPRPIYYITPQIASVQDDT